MDTTSSPSEASERTPIQKKNVSPNSESIPSLEKKLLTGTVYYGGFCHGLFMAFLGTILIDLQRLMNVGTLQISTVFTWRSVGVVAGCLAAGKLFSKFNQFLSLGICFTFMGFSILGLAWCTSLTYFSIVLLLSSFCAGYETTGQSAVILSLWSDHGASYIQALLVFILLGSSLCPQIVKPFLYDGSYPHHFNHAIAFVNPINGNYNSFAFLNSTNVNHTKVFVNSSIMGEVQLRMAKERNLKYTFILLAIFPLLSAIMYYIHFLASGLSLNYVQFDQEKKSDSVKAQTSPEISTLLKVVTLVEVAIVSFTFGAGSELISSFLVEYTTKGLKWEIKDGADIATVFFAADCLGRTASIVISKKFNSPPLLGCSVVLILICNILLISTCKYTSSTLWACVVGVGAGLGSMPGHIMFMCTSIVSRAEIAATLHQVSSSTGKLVLSPTVGFLLKNVSYFWFAYISFIVSIIMFIAYGALMFSLTLHK